jgi:hypothetical protein
MARYLALRSDTGVFLDLHACADFSVVADGAPVLIDELRELDISAHLYVRRD